jgi:hypothetical protein
LAAACGDPRQLTEGRGNGQDSQFRKLLTGVTATSATFVADEGPGLYSFRARLRKTADGTRSHWSPPAGISVN